MSPQIFHISGYEAFMNFVENLDKNEVVNFCFSGAKDEKGNSWCPDCVVAQPHIETAVEMFGGEGKFVYVDVGDRAKWKDPKCPFRTNKDTYLSVIPTLLRWKSPQKLEGDQCEKADLLEMFFADE